MNTVRTHTPTPWKILRLSEQAYIESEVQSREQPFIADMQLPECSNNEEYEEALANAEHIVRCVNLHEELIQALTTIVEHRKKDYLDNSIFPYVEAVKVLAKVRS
jgi:hypothetical protein